jgi:hypothetical protein
MAVVAMAVLSIGILSLVIFNPLNVVQEVSNRLNSPVNKMQAVVETGSTESITTIIKHTNLYRLDVEYIDNFISTPKVRGGGLTHINEKLLLATGDGKFYFIYPKKA